MQTNLCLYIRTLFVWMPFVVVVHAAVFAWLVYCFLVAPMMTFGTVPFGIFIAKTVGLVALAIGAIVGIFLTIDYFDRPLSTAEEEARKHAREAAAQAPPGFLKLCWQYVVATKRKICPLINLTETHHA